MPDHERPHRPLLSGDFTPNPPAGFVELGITTPFSFLRGASTADELVLTAHALGHDAIGVADLNSLAGVVRLHVAAVRAQMRPLIGARLCWPMARHISPIRPTGPLMGGCPR